MKMENIIDYLDAASKRLGYLQATKCGVAFAIDYLLTFRKSELVASEGNTTMFVRGA